MSSHFHCKTCNINFTDGIMRDGNAYCNIHCYINRHRHMSVSAPNLRSCNYCFVEYDTNIHAGVPFKNLWFCCIEHLRQADPRPKVAPAVVPAIIGHTIIGPQLVHRPFGPHIIAGPTLVQMPYGPHIMGPHIIGPHVRFFP